MMNRAIILDMDGVVIDSNPFHRKAWSVFLRRHGIEVNEEIFTRIIFGTTGDQAIRRLLGEDLTQEQLEGLVQEIDREYRSILSNSGRLEAVQGLIGFLESAVSEGFKLALATSAPPENIKLVVSGLKLEKYFDLVLDKSMVVKGKPDPEIYLKTVAGLKMDRENCIVFEDSMSGIRSALDAGLKVVGVTTSHSSDELLAAGAFKTIMDFTEINIAMFMPPAAC